MEGVGGHGGIVQERGERSGVRREGRSFKAQGSNLKFQGGHGNHEVMKARR